MEKLDLPTQMAVQALLNAAFLHFHTNNWKAFAEILNAGETVKARVHDHVALEDMAGIRKPTKPGDKERPRKVISKSFAVKLIAFCKAENGLAIDGEIKKQLDLLWGDDSPVKSNTPENPVAATLPGFIPTLGLNEDVALRSINRFSGDYLHFAINEDEFITTTRCKLSDKRGADAAPVVETKRWYSGEGLIEGAGVYFCEDKNLYLLASPQGEVDLRLSVFNVMPRKKATKQFILRGMALGVNPKKTIVASRCILIRSECVWPNIEDQLWNEPATIDSFKDIEAKPEMPKTTFRDMGEYLFGEETVDYIRLMKLSAPDY